MSRTLSATLLRAIFAGQTDQVLLPLLTISGTGMDTMRVTTNGTAIVSGGETYAAFPFTIDMPSESPERPPSVRLTICAVSREIIAAIRTLAAAPTATLSFVLASAPDTVEVGPFSFSIVSCEYDALTVQGELCYENVLQEPFPYLEFDLNHFPKVCAS